MKNIQHGKKALFGLSLATLGIVYGDIGTSPLYALNEVFFGRAHTTRTTTNILGVVSLVLWSLLIIVAIKYMLLVLRSDNEGEGGVFALYGLLHKYRDKAVIGSVMLALVLAAGFLYGDGLITPAISVLSATEGLGIITSRADNLVIPVTLVILTVLFAVQRRGTHKVGTVFGPIMVAWFGVLALLGMKHIISNPTVLRAINPTYAIHFAAHVSVTKLFLILGSVMLVVTGGEAVFADMGHFGRTPIRISWFSIVMPALMLNYLGQGGFLLSGAPIQNDNLFYSTVPHAFLVPMVLLATAATVIASQALISGAFSLTSQAIALDLLPKLHVNHTHEHHEGQIYLPFVNWGLYIGCILIVLAFKSSTALAAAYGLAVSVVMVVTSLSMIFVARLLWKWSWWRTLLLWLPLLAIDCLFLSANSLKFLEGGFVPLLIGVGLAFLMRSWLWGRTHVKQAYERARRQTVSELVSHIDGDVHHFPKSVLVLTGRYVSDPSDQLPTQLQLFYDKFQVLPNHLILLTVTRVRRAYVPQSERFKHTTFIEKDDRSFSSVQARFGYMEAVDVNKTIRKIAANNSLSHGDDMKNWLLLAGRERLHRRNHQGSVLDRMRYQLFRILARNSLPSYEYYGIGEDLRLVVENVPVNFDLKS